jgi:hypothetical protein
MLLRLVFGLLTCFFCCSGFSQERALQAVKALYKPKIDGSLDDEAWKQAPAVSDFIQNYPAYGQPSATRSVVKILYDNEAIYIGAYLYDDPQQIRSQLTSRDGEQRQDVIIFLFFRYIPRSAKRFPVPCYIGQCADRCPAGRQRCNRFWRIRRQNLGCRVAK